ncbi:MAG: sigma 54-interacting transcriptional regulator [Chthoniobacterales bacterium]
MVSVVQHRTLPEVLRAIVSGIARCENVALARIWLLNAGDLCATCRFRDECPDQSRCLHLVASAGNGGEADLTRTDGSFRRFPLGQRKIGRIATSGEPLLLPGVRGDEDWIADPEWFRSAKIRTFAGQPLVFHGEVLGVLAIFDRAVLGGGDFDWLRVFADHAAVSIANANAFEEIAYLKERLEEENSYLREEVSAVRGAGDLVGESPALRKVLQQIELVAPTDATVLVTGESGTGKELVARAIHERSARSGRPLITVNCGAVPEPLFESEFFGHVKGAFTGALRDKVGRFELADRGTLFLDEIGEIPLPMQAKLLRVLQEQEVERVGDPRPRKVNVRIIAATNRDLRAEVAARRFRQDLFYRLSVFPIENPPLRERREDIPGLAEHFIRGAAKRLNRRPPKFTQGAARQLAAQDWPGNVRELQNAVERAVILSQGGPLQFDVPASATPLAVSALPVADGAPLLTRAELKQHERASIAAALAQTGGRVSGPEGAAALLGMKPTTLASRIRALGLERRSFGRGSDQM